MHPLVLIMLGIVPRRGSQLTKPKPPYVTMDGKYIYLRLRSPPVPKDKPKSKGPLQFHAVALNTSFVFSCTVSEVADRAAVAA